MAVRLEAVARSRLVFDNSYVWDLSLVELAVHLERAARLLDRSLLIHEPIHLLYY